MSTKQILIILVLLYESSLTVYSSDRLANAVYSADTLVARFEITLSVTHPCNH